MRLMCNARLHTLRVSNANKEELLPLLLLLLRKGSCYTGSCLMCHLSTPYHFQVCACTHVHTRMCALVWGRGDVAYP